MSTIIHLMNPAAGKGRLPDKNSLSGEVYLTEKPGDAAEYLAKRISDGGDYTVYVYGGDGTLHEAANGIMSAESAAKVTLVPVPTGSGNDFYRVTGALSDTVPCDIIKYNDRYAINEVNVGFDCEVAKRTNVLKQHRFIGGSFAYILGVIVEFARKRATHLKISVTSEDGTVERFEDDFLLCAVANGRYYGGGFMAAPVADVSDGLLDVVIVKNIGRLRFISLIGAYKNGTHIDPETNDVASRLADVLIFRRAVKVEFEGAYRFSADGEIHENASGMLRAECIPSAVSVRSDTRSDIRSDTKAPEKELSIK